MSFQLIVGLLMAVGLGRASLVSSNPWMKQGSKAPVQLLGSMSSSTALYLLMPVNSHLDTERGHAEGSENGADGFKMEENPVDQHQSPFPHWRRTGADVTSLEGTAAGSMTSVSTEEKEKVKGGRDKLSSICGGEDEGAGETRRGLLTYSDTTVSRSPAHMVHPVCSKDG
ncbi:hypothetical protein EYF80_037272 [Liparis tanakae]|uniref:Uncharacterized protein n=1 Tax=Liparis tanakae TaxID=230148 RepID=A0A4Z2GH86_9TELE|nr:hypothetical protein EYF80_037272 [Liparis tanakae]